MASLADDRVSQSGRREDRAHNSPVWRAVVEESHVALPEICDDLLVLQRRPCQRVTGDKCVCAKELTLPHEKQRMGMIILGMCD
jgi:hypothetical protein